MPLPGKHRRKSPAPRLDLRGLNPMKSLVEKILVGSGVDSALRSGLGLLGAVLLANGATELPGECAAGLDTILELITGGLAVAGYIGLAGLVDSNGKLWVWDNSGFAELGEWKKEQGNFSTIFSSDGLTINAALSDGRLLSLNLSFGTQKQTRATGPFS